MPIQFTETHRNTLITIEPPMYLARRDFFPKSKTINCHEYCRIENGVVHIIMIYTERSDLIRFELVKKAFNVKAPREALNKFFADNWYVISESTYAEKLKETYEFVCHDLKL